LKLICKSPDEIERVGVEGAEAAPTAPGVGRVKVTEDAVIVVPRFASHALTTQVPAAE
jgi:hypothetical protein